MAIVLSVMVFIITFVLSWFSKFLNILSDLFIKKLLTSFQSKFIENLYVRFYNIHFIFLLLFVIILYRYKIFLFHKNLIREVLVWGSKNYKKIFRFFL